MADYKAASPPAPSAQPDRKAKATDEEGPGPLRLVPALFAHPPAAIDLGEQIVGSDHWYEFAPIQSVVGTQSTGVLHSWCEPAAASSSAIKIATQLGVNESAVTAATMTEMTGEDRREVSSAAPNPPLRVRYKPAKAGETIGVLHYSIRTHDGAVSQGSVMVRARARAIDASPTKMPESEAPSTRVEVPTVIDPSSVNPKSKDLTGAFERAKTAAEAIARSQKRGVDMAKAETEDYKRKVAPSSWWVTLAEIAVSAGIAGIAGIVAKHVASRAAKALGMSEEVRKHSPLILGIGDGFKEGFKASAKALRSGGSGKPSSGPLDDAENQLSSNPVIDFWQRQGLLLDQAETRNSGLVVDARERLLPLFEKDPSAAIATMEGVRDGLESDQESIIHFQAGQSAAQWVSAIAQSAHGSEKLATSDGARRTTDMSTVRDRTAPLRVQRQETARQTIHELDREATRRTNLDGVLQLEVVIPRGATSIPTDLVGKHARLNGIAQEIADRLAKRPLRELGIPVRIVVTGGSRAIITRDEVGRVRVTGRLPLGDRVTPDMPDVEVANIRAAMQLVDIVLAKELSSWWGRDPIQTDDEDKQGG